MSRTFPFVVALLAAAAPAAAQNRPASRAMTCRQTAHLVASRGALVLGTGGTTFDRFVADRRFCQPTEVAVPAFAPTLDHPQCMVGYRCKEPSRDELWEE